MPPSSPRSRAPASARTSSRAASIAAPLRRALAADKIVFSGVGKTEEEMRLALDGGLYQFNLESVAEAEMLSAVASSMGRAASIGFRVNPDVACRHACQDHDRRCREQVRDRDRRGDRRLCPRRPPPGLQVQGVAVHIGSQLISLDPLERAFTRVGELVGRLRDAGHEIRVADLGGGLGVPYDPALAPPPSPADYGAMVRRVTAGWDVRLVFEPGRLIVGNAGVLLSRVIRVKPGAAHPFVDRRRGDERPDASRALRRVAQDRRGPPLGRAVDRQRRRPGVRDGRHLRHRRARWTGSSAGDLIVFRTAGAYAAAMSSTYNSRPLTPEVLVDGARWAVVRPRIDVDRLIAADRVPDWLSGCADAASS